MLDNVIRIRTACAHNEPELVAALQSIVWRSTPSGIRQQEVELLPKYIFRGKEYDGRRFLSAAASADTPVASLSLMRSCLLLALPPARMPDKPQGSVVSTSGCDAASGLTTAVHASLSFEVPRNSQSVRLSQFHLFCLRLHPCLPALNADNIHATELHYFVGPVDVPDTNYYSGYSMVQINSTRICETYVSDECVIKRGADVCVMEQVRGYKHLGHLG